MSLSSICLFVFVTAIWAIGLAQARDLHVDPSKGDDKSDGLAQPVRSIKQAIRLAQPGDTIYLEKATYYESAEFGKKSGEAGQPIILDGHGAILEGSEPVTKQDWELVSPGLYRNSHLLPKIEPFVLQRWFMLFGDQMVHMGRTSKGKLTPFKQPAELHLGDWTWAAGEEAFYIRIAPERDLDAAKIRYPARSSGVAIGGASHLVVRNLTCTHFFNDGFNVHGSARDCRFEYIQAIECGDDGFSAHEDAVCEIDGFRSVGNSTGFTDINSSETHYRRVIVLTSLAYDFLFQGDGTHSVRDAVIASNAETPFNVSSPDANATEPCRVTLHGLQHMRMDGKAVHVQLGARTRVLASRCSFYCFLPLESKGDLSLEGCVVSPVGGANFNLEREGTDIFRWLPDLETILDAK